MIRHYQFLLFVEAFIDRALAHGEPMSVATVNIVRPSSAVTTQAGLNAETQEKLNKAFADKEAASQAAAKLVEDERLSQEAQEQVTESRVAQVKAKETADNSALEALRAVAADLGVPISS